MALIVEDGTGLPDANSFASLAEADAQHADWETAAWFPLSDYQKTAGMLEAIHLPRRDLQLDRLHPVRHQGGPWPRLEAYDHEGG